ncbi:MAG: SDR family oxidoreductase [Granulosicoccaceae bacterium]
MRHVLVTGSSRGIGRAIVKALLESGYNVTGISRSNTNPIEGMTFHFADLNDIDTTSRLINNLCSTENISAVVCNAGSGKFGSLETHSPTQISQHLQLNLCSPLVVAQAALPLLKKHARSDLIFMGSESSMQGGRYGSLYSAAKFGLRGAAQSLKHECASANCHVGIVQPGMVRTSFFDELDFEPGPSDDNAILPDEVAKAVISMLEASDHTVIDEIVLNPIKRVVQKK